MSVPRPPLDSNNAVCCPYCGSTALDMGPPALTFEEDIHLKEAAFGMECHDCESMWTLSVWVGDIDAVFINCAAPREVKRER